MVTAKVDFLYVDEAADCSNKERFPLLLFFLIPIVIWEEFVGFVLCDIEELSFNQLYANIATEGFSHGGELKKRTHCNISVFTATRNACES